MCVCVHTASGFVFNHGIGVVEGGSAASVGGKASKFPGWYGICSKEGKRIYTVPVEGGLGEAECIVVGDKRVVDTGSLGRHLIKTGH